MFVKVYSSQSTADFRYNFRTSFETDINQLLQNVDAVPQTLQSMQQLIQWVADVTLYLLASVPYHVSRVS